MTLAMAMEVTRVVINRRPVSVPYQKEFFAMVRVFVPEDGVDVPIRLRGYYELCCPVGTPVTYSR
jgi:hypothetical protein